MAYDEKFRCRALEYWAAGHTKKETALVFKVNPDTLQKWKKQFEETGNLESKTRRETWRKIDPARLVKYLEQHPDSYLRELAAEFNCSDVAIIKALRRLKISRKKTTLYGEADESFRQSFIGKEVL